VYLIHRGSVCAEVEAPRTGGERERLEQIARDIHPRPGPLGAPVLTHEIDEILFVAAWFRRFPAKLGRTAPLG